MGIRIGGGKVQRDWGKVANAAAEAVTQAFALGKDGFSAATSALFRTFEALHGNDTTEIRATRLVIETLSYAVSATIAASKLTRKPQQPEAALIITGMIARAENFMAQETIELESKHIENPASLSLFEDAASHIFYELRLCDPLESEANVAARFRRFASEGLNRIKMREPDYFSTVFSVLSGPAAHPDARVRAWDLYRANLIRRYEDEALFGEDKAGGVTLAPPQ